MAEGSWQKRAHFSHPSETSAISHQPVGHQRFAIAITQPSSHQALPICHR
jgi:hypothetical protein